MTFTAPKPPPPPAPWFPIVLVLSVCGVTAWLLARSLARPLAALSSVAQQFGSGQFTARASQDRADEFGDVARAFNEMAQRVSSLMTAEKELIANVSHELRTPIFALQAVLENVVDGVSDPQTLRTALAQTERLGRLVTELLDLSRIEAGAVPLELAEFDVTEFLQEAVREAEVAAHAAGRAVSFEASDLPLVAVADPARLHQVLANLLDNAARHSPDGGIVTAVARREAGRFIIEVTDQGPGIPPERRAGVFERFTRGERSDGQAGTGLGLAIARWAVELHGGEIAVVDAPKPGCRIRVALPAR
jgi:signal transduction histidine kinase